MNCDYYAVRFLTNDGDLVTLTVKAWHAAAAEKAVALIHGGFFHDAILIEQGETAHA